MRNLGHYSFFIILLLLCGRPVCSAQSPGTGAISGAVLDPDGLPIKGASITLTRDGTHSNIVAVTGTNGAFAFPLLTPATYTLKAEASGFAGGELSKVEVAVGEVRLAHFQLRPAAVKESVDVSAESLDIAQTESSTLGRVVTQRAVEELPLSTRNFTQILSLSPGVSVSVPDATQVGRGTQNVSADGNKTVANNIQFNGVDANNLAQNSARNANEEVGVAVPAPDTIQEFKAQTANFDAGYGRGSGANVDVISKSGSNDLHGSAWEFVRNDLLNANLFFAKRDGASRPTLKQNQFGGRFGGPIHRDRTFFFGAYQGTRSANGVGGAKTVFLPQLTSDRSAATLGAQFCPSAANRVPDPYLTYAGGVQVACDGSNINSAALALLNSKLSNGQFAIPSPQVLLSTNAGEFPVGESTFTPSTYFNEDQYTFDLDHRLLSRDQLASRFFYAKAPTHAPFSPAGASVPGWGSDELDKNLMFIVSENHVSHSQVSNVARLALMRFDGAERVNNPISAAAVHMLSPTGLSGADTPAPAIAFEGLFSIGDAGTPSQTQLTNSYILQDFISLTHGRQNIRLGGEFKRYQVMDNPLYTRSGYIDFRTFDDFLLGQSAAQNQSPNGLSNVTFSMGSSGILRKDERYSDFAAFVQDDIRLIPRLTINAGIRYEIFGAPVEAHGRLATFDPSTALTSVPAGGSLSGYLVPSNYAGKPPQGVQRTSYRGLWQNRFNDISPRLGFAWQIFGRPALVLRGGAGLYYSRTSANTVEGLIIQPPFSTFVFAFGAANSGATLQAPLSPLLPLDSAYPLFPNRIPGSPGITLSAVSPHMHDQYTEEYNLNVQYAFAHNYLLEAGYVGNKSVHQFGCNEFNQALLASPAAPVHGETTNTIENVANRLPYDGMASGSLLCATSYQANYNGLQASVTRRFGHGFQLLASYTWSKTLDQLSGSGGADVYDGWLLTNDQHNPRQAYGPSDLDRSHRAVLSLVYETPRDGRLPWIAKAVVRNWRVSTIGVIQSGTPLTITDSNAGLVYGNYENRAQAPTKNPYTSGSTFTRSLPGNAYLDANAFPSAPIAAYGAGAFDTDFGNSSVGFLRGPGQRNIDLAITRLFPIREARSFELRAEFFNLTNTTNFANPDTNLAHGPSFGLIQSASSNPRIIQLAAKYLF